MQLSLPPTLPTVSDVTAAGPSAANSLGGFPTGTTPPDSFGASFETLLQGDDPESESAEMPEEPRAGDAAAFMAAALWMPLNPLPLGPIAAEVAGQATGGDAPAQVTTSLFFAAPSARAFTSVVVEPSQTCPADPAFPEGASSAVAPPTSLPAAPKSEGALPLGPGRIEVPAAENSSVVSPGEVAPVAAKGIEPDDVVRTTSSESVADKSVVVEFGAAKTTRMASVVEAPVQELSAGNAKAAPSQPGAQNQVPTSAATSEGFPLVSAPVTILDARNPGPTTSLIGPPIVARPLEAAAVTQSEVPSQVINEVAPVSLGSDAAVPALADRSIKADKIFGQEKNAAGEMLSAENVVAIKQVGEKYFLNSGYKPLTPRAAGVGTGIAQVESAMPATSPNRAKFDLKSELQQTMPMVGGAANAPALTSAAATIPTSSVRETMATVVSVVDALERRDAVEQKSVNLQFKVGGEALALRVELRDGTVHTIFRTESADLRAALAHAWQSVTTQVENRTQRLADPVFTTSHDSLPSASDGGAQQQRDTGARQNLPQADGFHRRRPMGVVATEITDAVRPTLPSVSTNVHLHTFA